MEDHVSALASEMEVEWKWVDRGVIEGDSLGCVTFPHDLGAPPLIECERIRDRRNYFVALHELGHVRRRPGLPAAL